MAGIDEGEVVPRLKADSVEKLLQRRRLFANEATVNPVCSDAASRQDGGESDLKGVNPVIRSEEARDEWYAQVRHCEI